MKGYYTVFNVEQVDQAFSRGAGEFRHHSRLSSSTSPAVCLFARLS
jgi:hypothetical protein